MALQTFHTYLTAAEAADNWPILTIAVRTMRLLRITHRVVGSGTPSVTFNLEKRGETTPFTPGTDVWSADKTATAASATVTAFDAGDLASRESLFFVASAINGTVDEVHISGEYDLVPQVVSVDGAGIVVVRGKQAVVLIEDVFHGVIQDFPGLVAVSQCSDPLDAFAGTASGEYTSYKPSRPTRRTPGRRDVRATPPPGPWRPFG